MAMFKSLGDRLAAYQNRIARTEQIAALQSLSDTQLAARGLTRDRIAHYVFRDMTSF